MSAWIIYFIGIVVLGLSYAILKQNLSGVVLLLAAITYLALLSWIAHRYGKK